MRSRERTSACGWLITPAPNAAAHRRLVCFAYAGGSASLFRSWAAALPDTEIVAVQLPGRENRYMEPPVDDFEVILTNICRHISAECLDKPYALLGYSLGALLAFEVARQMRVSSCREAQALLVAARCAPHLPLRSRRLHTLPDDDFVQGLQQLQGTPEQVFREPELLQLLLPMLRADLKLHEAYRHTAGEPLDCPLFVFGGEADTSVPAEDMLAWRRHSRGSFGARFFDAGHFFIHSHREALLAQVADILQSLPMSAHAQDATSS